MNEELRVIISAEIEDLQRNVNEAKQEVEKFTKQGESNLTKFGNASKAVGKAVASGLKVATAAVAACGAALVALSESTAEYRTNQAKLTSAFETAGATAEEATQVYNDLYRVLGDDGQAIEAANHLAQLTTNEKELAEWTNICQGVYATFGDSLPIEGLTEAANETAKVGQVTGGLADALNWAGISEDAFNEKLAKCNSEAEREALIRQTLNDIYGEASANYEKNAADILAANEAQAALTAGLAALGEAVTPVVTIFKQGLADVLQELTPHLEVVSAGLQDILNGVDGGEEKLSQGIAGIVDSLLNTVTTLLPTILSVGVNLITSLIEGIVQALPSVISTIVALLPQILDALLTLIPQVTGAILNALPELLGAVIQIVAGIIQGLGQLLPTIVIQIIEIVPMLVQSLLENLPVLLRAAITFLLAIVQAIPKIVPAIVDALPVIIESILNALIDAMPVLLDGAILLFTEIVKAIPVIIPQLITALLKIVSTVQTTLANRLGDIFKGIWNGIVNIFKNSGTWFGSIFKTAFNSIKAAFSGVANFFSGIWTSIKNIFSKVGATIGNAITNTVKKAINGVLSTAIKIINGFISAINTAISVINAIPGVSIKKLSKLSVPQLEKGGVLKKGQIGLLEGNGAEAVVPLEKNTEWLDKIAERLNGALGGSGAPIYLQVDGKTFAEISVDTINQLTKQRGSLPLRLA